MTWAARAKLHGKAVRPGSRFADGRRRHDDIGRRRGSLEGQRYSRHGLSLQDDPDIRHVRSACFFNWNCFLAVARTRVLCRTVVSVAGNRLESGSCTPSRERRPADSLPVSHQESTMNAKRFRRGLTVLFVLGVVPFCAGQAAKDQPSALESDPKGWMDMLSSAGADLEGWTRAPIPPGGMLREESQWSLDPKTGNLVCKGDGGHEWLRCDQSLTDFLFHVEWRYTPVPGKKGYNSGVYVRNSSDAKIWHQAQCGDASGGYLFGETSAAYALKPFNFSKDMKEQRVKPAGEWNIYEFTCKGRNVSLWVNGAVTNEWKGCQVPRGYIGLEAEGWRIEFRNVKVKML
jgi:hypothetical protein